MRNAPAAGPGAGQRAVAAAAHPRPAVLDPPTGPGLAELEARITRLFDRIEPRRQAVGYVRALVAHSQRKNGWLIAQQIGDAAPWRTQRLLNRARWDADRLRDVVRDYLVERLAAPAATVAVGELAVRKKGTASVGVAAQYDAATQRVENCQVGLFAAYLGGAGSGIVDRELYLPPEWTRDVGRRRVGGIPAERGPATKPELARLMLERLVAAGVPFSWVTGDVTYGRDPAFRAWLAGQRRGYLLEVPRSAAEPAHPAWQQLAVEQAGTDREALWWWRPVRVPGDGADRLACVAAEFQSLLLARRPVGEPRRAAHYVLHAPAAMAAAEVAGLLAARHRFGACLQAACTQAGLDQYEVRTWTAWYRHVTLAMTAAASLAPAGPGRPAAAAAVSAG